MRHLKKNKQLSRKYAHRRSLLSNMSMSLIIHKRIFTTLAKGKELKKYIEPILTRSKNNNTHSKRMIFKHLNNKKIIKIIFSEISKKIINRNGGYTRLIKSGFRYSDGSKMVMVELVDFSDM